jgi:hypothetical protein
MTINYNDPAQTTHQGTPIPIDTPAKYLAGEKVMQAIYAAEGFQWNTEASAAYEQRVRNGMTLREIIVASYAEYAERSTNTPGAGEPS